MLRLPHRVILVVVLCLGLGALGILAAHPAPGTHLSDQMAMGHHGHDGIVKYKLASTAGGVFSVKSGNWSDPTVWSSGQSPQAGDSIDIAAGHTVNYDIASGPSFGPT